MTDRARTLPRCMNGADVAAYLGMSVSSFTRKRSDMERAGFPPRDALTGRYDKLAIDRWLDSRSGFDANSAGKSLWIAELEHGQGGD